MYTPWSKLSIEEQLAYSREYGLNECYLRDITNEDLEELEEEGSIFIFSVDNLTAQLNKIKELGDYTILANYNGEIEIFAYNGFSKLAYIKVSTIMKAIFDIKVSMVIPIKVKVVYK